MIERMLAGNNARPARTLPPCNYINVKHNTVCIGDSQVKKIFKNLRKKGDTSSSSS
jgi:hypothetical protein